MTTTPSNAIAPRNGTAVPAQTPSAVAIRNGQAEFDDKQRAALVAMGVSEKVTRAELAVFFHQCRTLRLDPFQRQIYLIHRRAKEGDRWVDKPTTQIGIDGFRVTRDRVCEERGLSVSYEDTLWYDVNNQSYEVWLWDEPPAACKFVVLVDDGKRIRRFPSVLRFNEYCQFGKEDASGQRPRTGRWRDGFAHQIEKCAEADALRRAFPNDLSGVILEDAAPLDDPDAPPRQPDRQRVTAEQARQRAGQPRHQAGQVNSTTGEVVDAEIIDEHPWPDGTVAAPPEQPGDASPHADVLGHFGRLGITSHADRAAYLSRITGKQVASVESMNREQAGWFAQRLAPYGSKEEPEAATVALEVQREGNGEVAGE